MNSYPPLIPITVEINEIEINFIRLNIFLKENIRSYTRARSNVCCSESSKSNQSVKVKIFFVIKKFEINPKQIFTKINGDILNGIIKVAKIDKARHKIVEK